MKWILIIGAMMNLGIATYYVFNRDFSNFWEYNMYALILSGLGGLYEYLKVILEAKSDT